MHIPSDRETTTVSSRASTLSSSIIAALAIPEVALVVRDREIACSVLYSSCCDLGPNSEGVTCREGDESIYWVVSAEAVLVAERRIRPFRQSLRPKGGY